MVRAVTSETTTSRARVLTLVAERRTENRSNLIELSINGTSADDLTELAARVALLRELNSLDKMALTVNEENPPAGLVGSQCSPRTPSSQSCSCWLPNC
jgi:hypothetical protein